MRTILRWGILLSCLTLCLPGLVENSAEAKAKTWVANALPGGSDWVSSWAWDVSDSGYIVGYWSDADYGVHPVYWYKGRYHDIIEEIGLPGDFTGGNLFTVNAAGLAGGAMWTGDYLVQSAVLYDLVKGTAEDIHPYGLDDGLLASFVNGLNASGDVVGGVVIDTGLSVDVLPFFWPKGDPEAGEILPLGDFVSAQAWNVSSSGTIAGYADDSEGNTHAVVWERVAGVYEIVDLLPEMVSAGVLASWAYDVNESGVVTGLAMLAEIAENGFNESRAFTWSEAKGFALLDDGGKEFAAGWKIVGNLVTGGLGLSPSFYADQAAVWEKGKLEVLPRLTGYGYMSSNSVNKSGVVVGVVFDDEGDGPLNTWAFSAEKK